MKNEGSSGGKRSPNQDQQDDVTANVITCVLYIKQDLFSTDYFLYKVSINNNVITSFIPERQLIIRADVSSCHH